MQQRILHYILEVFCDLLPFLEGMKNNCKFSKSHEAGRIATIILSSIIILSFSGCTISDVTVTRGEGIEEGQEIDLSGVKRGHELLRGYKKMGKDLEKASVAR